MFFPNISLSCFVSFVQNDHVTQTRKLCNLLRTRSENNSSGVLERSSVNATGSEAGSGIVAGGKGTSRQPAVAQPAATHEKTKAKVAAASEVAAARRQRALDEAAGTQDARVLNFLDRMRNDKKFQISLSNPPSMNAATGTFGN